MVQKISELKYPSGFSRMLYRTPIWLYKVNLGWVLGKRFLKLTHVGRISGKSREAVLEVVSYDSTLNAYYIASAWGEKSDWVKNIQANPDVIVQIGREKSKRTATQLPAEEGEGVILDYAKRHPTAMLNLARFMGYQLDGTENDFRQLGRLLLMFSLLPRRQGMTA